jgi:ubiquinone/menaquinone biosynthesis C-methylase UbiE
MNIFENIDIAKSYDEYYLTPFGKRVDELEKRNISALLKTIPHKNLLELGCGTGHWTSFFAENGYTVTAIDESNAMLTEAKQKNIPNTQFINADCLHLPFENDSIDVIVSITMLEFVENLPKAFSEIYRVLKPNGWLILGCLNEHSILGQTKQESETFKYAHFFTSDELNSYVTAFGNPILHSCVHLSSTFEILDQTEQEKTVEGAFISVCVQKVKNNQLRIRN